MSVLTTVIKQAVNFLWKKPARLVVICVIFPLGLFLN